MPSSSITKQAKALASFAMSIHLSGSLSKMTNAEIADLLMEEVWQELPSGSPLSLLIEEVVKRLRAS